MKSFRIVGAKALLLILCFAFKAQAQGNDMGTLTVRGQPGPSQLFAQVKAVRCEVSSSIRRCGSASYLKLNQSTPLPAGSYIVGFENSIYAGWVHVRSGSSVTLDLVKLTVPTSVRRGADKVKVFRDFDSDVEKKKLYFVQFYLSRPLFRLSQYYFGDLYLASAGQLDVTLRLNYDACNRLNLKNPDIEDALEICLAAMRVKTWRDMSVFFQFNGKDHMERTLLKGHFIQNLVSEAGDRRQIVMRRHLVSAPMKAHDFISVFPGQYRFLSEAPGANSVSVTAGSILENFD